MTPEEAYQKGVDDTLKRISPTLKEIHDGVYLQGIRQGATELSDYLIDNFNKYKGCSSGDIININVAIGVIKYKADRYVEKLEGRGTDVAGI